MMSHGTRGASPRPIIARARRRNAGTRRIFKSSFFAHTSPHLRNPAEQTADGLFTDMLGESEPSSPYGTREVPQKRYLKTKGGGLKIKGGWTPEEDAHLLR